MDHKPATLKANIYLNDTPIAANLSKLLLTLLDDSTVQLLQPDYQFC